VVAVSLAPGLCGGASLQSTDPLWQFELRSTRIEGSEVFLHYQKRQPE
jgi:hypothetical protein